MTVFFHELRRGRIPLLIWSSAIAFMLGVCVIIYPEMSTQMGDISQMFADMGAFSEAFGMDQLNFGEFMGYFGIECGNTLGLGGALFAAIVGASALAREEREHTAEFLLTHPVSRTRIITEKLLAAMVQVCLLNVAVIAVTFVCIAIVGVDADVKALALLFLAYLILQLEITAVTFGLSAFLRRGELGVGLGLVFAMYFVNILANLTEELKLLKFITPYSFADGAHIVPEKSLDMKYLAVGLAFTSIGIAAAYGKYRKKDIA
jgi:ABC-2 type transport system permease protein